MKGKKTVKLDIMPGTSLNLGDVLPINVLILFAVPEYSSNTHLTPHIIGLVFR